MKPSPFVECSVCGREFGSKSIIIHERQCLQKLRRTEIQTTSSSAPAEDSTNNGGIRKKKGTKTAASRTSTTTTVRVIDKDLGFIGGGIRNTSRDNSYYGAHGAYAGSGMENYGAEPTNNGRILPKIKQQQGKRKEERPSTVTLTRPKILNLDFINYDMSLTRIDTSPGKSTTSPGRNSRIINQGAVGQLIIKDSTTPILPNVITATATIDNNYTNGAILKSTTKRQDKIKLPEPNSTLYSTFSNFLVLDPFKKSTMLRRSPTTGTDANGIQGNSLSTAASAESLLLPACTTNTAADAPAQPPTTLTSTDSTSASSTAFSNVANHVLPAVAVIANESSPIAFTGNSDVNELILPTTANKTDIAVSSIRPVAASAKSLIKKPFNQIMLPFDLPVKILRKAELNPVSSSSTSIRKYQKARYGPFKQYIPSAKSCHFYTYNNHNLTFKYNSSAEEEEQQGQKTDKHEFNPDTNKFNVRNDGEIRYSILDTKRDPRITKDKEDKQLEGEKQVPAATSTEAGDIITTSVGTDEEISSVAEEEKQVAIAIGGRTVSDFIISARYEEEKEREKSQQRNSSEESSNISGSTSISTAAEESSTPQSSIDIREEENIESTSASNCRIIKPNQPEEETDNNKTIGSSEEESNISRMESICQQEQQQINKNQIADGDFNDEDELIILKPIKENTMDQLLSTSASISNMVIDNHSSRNVVVGSGSVGGGGQYQVYRNHSRPLIITLPDVHKTKAQREMSSQTEMTENSPQQAKMETEQLPKLVVSSATTASSSVEGYIDSDDESTEESSCSSNASDSSSNSSNITMNESEESINLPKIIQSVPNQNSKRLARSQSQSFQRGSAPSLLLYEDDKQQAQIKFVDLQNEGVLPEIPSVTHGREFYHRGNEMNKLPLLSADLPTINLNKEFQSEAYEKEYEDEDDILENLMSLIKEKQTTKSNIKSRQTSRPQRQQIEDWLSTNNFFDPNAYIGDGSSGGGRGEQLVTSPISRPLTAPAATSAVTSSASSSSSPTSANRNSTIRITDSVTINRPRRPSTTQSQSTNNTAATASISKKKQQLPPRSSRRLHSTDSLQSLKKIDGLLSAIIRIQDKDDKNKKKNSSSRSTTRVYKFKDHIKFEEQSQQQRLPRPKLIKPTSPPLNDTIKYELSKLPIETNYHHRIDELIDVGSSFTMEEIESGRKKKCKSSSKLLTTKRRPSTVTEKWRPAATAVINSKQRPTSTGIFTKDGKLRPPTPKTTTRIPKNQLVLKKTNKTTQIPEKSTRSTQSQLSLLKSTGIIPDNQKPATPKIHTIFKRPISLKSSSSSIFHYQNQQYEDDLDELLTLAGRSILTLEEDHIPIVSKHDGEQKLAANKPTAVTTAGIQSSSTGKMSCIKNPTHDIYKIQPTEPINLNPTKTEDVSLIQALGFTFLKPKLVDEFDELNVNVIVRKELNGKYIPIDQVVNNYLEDWSYLIIDTKTTIEGTAVDKEKEMGKNLYLSPTIEPVVHLNPSNYHPTLGGCGGGGALLNVKSTKILRNKGGGTSNSGCKSKTKIPKKKCNNNNIEEPSLLQLLMKKSKTTSKKVKAVVEKSVQEEAELLLCEEKKKKKKLLKIEKKREFVKNKLDWI